MNKFAAVFYVLFFAVVGIHNKYAYKGELNTSKRFPSSVTNPSCTRGITHLFKRSYRGRRFKALLRSEDIDGIKKLFWDSHNAERLMTKIHSTRFTKWVRQRNQSTFVPALFQTKNNFVKSVTGEDIDTMSTIWKVVDEQADYSADEVKAVENVRGWINHVQRYQLRINRYLENSVEYHSQIDSIRNLQYEPWMSDIDGEGVKIPMVTTTKNDDGTIEVEIKTSRFFPTSQTDIDYKIKDLEHETSTIFAGNFAREARKKSKLYEAMLDQALFWRRLELINERFGRVAVDKLSEEQKSLMRDIRYLLSNPSEFAPRTDAMAWVKKKEARVELWQGLRFWKSNRVAADAEFEMPKFMLDRSASISPVALATPLFLVVGGSIKTMITNMYEDNPHYQYYTSLIGNGYNNFFFKVLNWPSSAMRDCFKADRHWTRNELSQKAVIDAHLSRWVALDRLEPEKKHLESEEFIRLRNDLFAECRERSLEHRSMEIHEDGKAALMGAQVSRLMAHKILEEIIIKHFPQGRRLSSDVYSYFEEREYGNDREAEGYRTKIIERAGQEFFDQLVAYEENLLLIEDRLKESHFNSTDFYPDIQSYFDYINDLAIEEASKTE